MSKKETSVPAVDHDLVNDALKYRWLKAQFQAFYAHDDVLPLWYLPTAFFARFRAADFDTALCQAMQQWEKERGARIFVADDPH